jgi:hypothetical protein
MRNILNSLEFNKPRKSIADNHLSSFAQMGKEGRGGDDRMLFFSDGRIEHGNREEEQLMGSALGEKIVDSIGSKTINPKTGLRENEPITTGLLVAGTLFSALGSALGGGARNRAAKAKIASANQIIADADKAADNALELKGAEEKSAVSDYHAKTEQVGYGKDTTERKVKEISERSGLATSAGANEKMSDMWHQFSTGAKGVFAELGKTMGQISGSFEKNMADIISTKKRAEMEKKAAEASADAWYLGKNIGF